MTDMNDPAKKPRDILIGFGVNVVTLGLMLWATWIHSWTSVTFAALYVVFVLGDKIDTHAGDIHRDLARRR